MALDHEFAPELQLSEEERVNLAIAQSSPGFQVLQKIFRSAIDTFTLAMMNAPEDSEECHSRHRSAKVAAQLYTLFIDRVSREVETYIKAPRITDRPLDVTEDLDIQPFAFDDANNNSEEGW